MSLILGGQDILLENYWVGKTYFFLILPYVSKFLGPNKNWDLKFQTAGIYSFLWDLIFWTAKAANVSSNLLIPTSSLLKLPRTP